MLLDTHLVVSEDYQVLLKNCVPRAKKPIMSNLLTRTRTPWTVEVSTFKEYLKEENAELINSCFEFDWKNMKQLRYKQSPESDVKELLRTVYWLIKEHYKI